MKFWIVVWLRRRNRGGDLWVGIPSTMTPFCNHGNPESEIEGEEDRTRFEVELGFKIWLVMWV